MKADQTKEATVRFDADVLRHLDEVAARLGRSRDELIEDSVRRNLAGQMLSAIFQEHDDDADRPDPDQAMAIILEDQRDERRGDMLADE